MKNQNQPYDLNNYRPFRVRKNPYDLSSEPIKTQPAQTERTNPYNPSQSGGLARLAELERNSLG